VLKLQFVQSPLLFYCIEIWPTVDGCLVEPEPKYSNMVWLQFLRYQGKTNLTVQDTYWRNFLTGSGLLSHSIICCEYKWQPISYSDNSTLGLLVFGRPFVKRFALCYQTVVCPVCDVGVLWPNGWMDQDETWHESRPRPRPHCVRWGPSFPSPKGHTPQFTAMSVVAKRLDGLRCHLVRR